LDYSSLSVRDPSELVVAATFFLATPAVFTASGATSVITGVYMHANTYAVGGNSIQIDPAFVDGSDCDISDDIGDAPKATRASQTIVHLETPSSSFTAYFPELLLPSIEQVEYSFSNSSSPSVTVQFQVPVRGTVTIKVAQAVHGVPSPPGHWANAYSGLCLDTNNHWTADGTPVNTWSCVAGANNEVFLADKEGHFVGQNSHKCLSDAGCDDGAGACIQPCVAGKDLWSIGTPDTNGRMPIRVAANQTMCLEAAGKTLGSDVRVATCATPLSLSQLWSVA
jgi:hypothetical protein